MKFQFVSIFFKLIGITLCFLFWNEIFFWWIMIPFLVSYVLIAIISSYMLQLNMHIQSIQKPSENGVLLTFDDGPDPKHTPSILDTLQREKISAVFFVIGKHAEKHPDLIQRIQSDGHILGNHSYSHHYLLPFFTSKRLQKDFEKCASVIRQIIGVKPLLLRPPFGATSPKYFKAFKKMTYQSVGWNIRTYDTIAKSKDEFLQRSLKHLRENESQIMLLHDSKATTAKGLEELIGFIRKKGLNFLSPEQALKTRMYEN